MFTTNIYEIPLKPENQTFRINLNGIDYTFTLRWNSRAEHWILNIGDTFDRPLINGIPLVIGVNLLAGHKCFAIGGIGTNLFIRSVAESFTSPNILPRDPAFDDLGTKTRLYFGVNIPDNQIFIPGQNDFRPLPLPPVTTLITRFILFDESCHLFVSEDFGATWSRYNSPPGTMHDGWPAMAMATNDEDYITLAGQDASSGLNNAGAITLSPVEGFTSRKLISVSTDTGLAITSNGQIIVACNDSNSPCYISRDKGVNWTAFAPDTSIPPFTNWSAVAFSQNANIAYMWGDYDGKIWKSTDNLNTWTELLNSDSYGFIGTPRLRCSKDGNTIAVGDIYSGDWYISFDGGNTWVYTSFQNLVDPSEHQVIWQFDFGMTPDGKLLLACAYAEQFVSGVQSYFGFSWTSTDGNTWTPHTLPIITDGDSGEENQRAMVCNVSPDGKCMLIGYESGDHLQAAISTDEGETWIGSDFTMGELGTGPGYWVDSYIVYVSEPLQVMGFANGTSDETIAYAIVSQATNPAAATLYRVGVPTGVVDSGVGIFSVWLEYYYSSPNNTGGDIVTITGNPGCTVTINGSHGQVTVQLQGKIGATTATFFGVGGVNSQVDGNQWNHILISWDTNHPAGSKVLQIFVNGVALALSSITDTNGPFLCNYASNVQEYSFFASHAAGQTGGGCFYDLYFAPGQYLDLSVPDNVQKFRTIDGLTVDLGLNGQYPTGIPPAFFFHKDNYDIPADNTAYNFTINQGTGGLFSYTGQFILCFYTAPPTFMRSLASGHGYARGVAPLVSIGLAAGHATVTGIALIPPILLVHFDGTNGSTTFTDTVGSHTLTPTGATVNTSAPKFGTGAGSFTASSGRIAVNNPANFNIGTRQFTIDAWIRFTSTPSGGGVYGVLTQFGGSSNLGWFLGQVSGQAAFYYSTSGFDNPNIGAAFTPTLNTWYHLAVDRDASNVIRVYVNGTVVASATVSSAIFASTQACVIGNDNNNVRAFPGFIDELRMVMGGALYGGAFTPPTAPYTP